MNVSKTEQPSELEIMGECISDTLTEYDLRFVDSRGHDISQILPWEDDGSIQGALVAYLKDEKNKGYKIVLSHHVFQEELTADAEAKATASGLDIEAHPAPSDALRNGDC